jgi:hypothetical protein
MHRLLLEALYGPCENGSRLHQAAEVNPDVFSENP